MARAARRRQEADPETRTYWFFFIDVYLNGNRCTLQEKNQWVFFAMEIQIKHGLPIFATLDPEDKPTLAAIGRVLFNFGVLQDLHIPDVQGNFHIIKGDCLVQVILTAQERELLTDPVNVPQEETQATKRNMVPLTNRPRLFSLREESTD